MKDFACLIGAILYFFLPLQAWACSVCFGGSDRAVNLGLRWGVFSLLIILLFVLGLVARFIWQFNKRVQKMS